MKTGKFPTKEEFKNIIYEFKKEKAVDKEGEYLAYLKDQKMSKKPRKLKRGCSDQIKMYR